MGRLILAIAGVGLFGAVAAALPGAVAQTAVAASSDETLKERLSDKASDEQRVDDCKVPLEKRGPKHRPADCAPGVASSPHAGEHRVTIKSPADDASTSAGR